MKVVNQISCVNHGGFQQKFQVLWVNEGAGGWSDYYNNPDSRSFELTDFSIPGGAEVWIEVHAFMGKTKSSKDHVKYSANAQASAIYKTTGGTLDFHISLED